MVWPVDTCVAGGSVKDRPAVAVMSMMLLAGMPVVPLIGQSSVVFAVIDKDS